VYIKRISGAQEALIFLPIPKQLNIVYNSSKAKVLPKASPITTSCYLT